MSKDEITAMRQSLNVIKDAASKKIREKDSEIRELEAQNESLRRALDREGGASQERAHAITRVTDDVSALERELQDAKHERLKLRDKLLESEREKNELVLRLVSSQKEAQSLQQQLADAQRRYEDLLARMGRMEDDFRRRDNSESRSHQPSRSEELALEQMATEKRRLQQKFDTLEDETREKDRRLARMNAAGQQARRTLQGFDADVRRARTSEEREALLMRRADVADRYMKDLLGADGELGDNIRVERSRSPIITNSAVSINTSNLYDPDFQNATWKNKADNLTHELQVLQSELRRHLLELRGDTQELQDGPTPSRGADGMVVVVSPPPEEPRREERRRREEERREPEPARKEPERPAKKDERVEDGRPDLELHGDPVEGTSLLAWIHPRVGADLEKCRFSWRRRSHSETETLDHKLAEYTMTAEDVDSTIECVVRPVDRNGTELDTIRARVGPVRPAHPTFLRPRIEGDPYNTTVFRFAGQYMGGEEGTHRYQWYKSHNGRDWVTMEDKTKRELQATSDEIDSYLRCVVTPGRADGRRGPEIGANTELIRLEPELEKEIMAHFDRGTVEFNLTIQKMPGADDKEPRNGKLELAKDKLILRGSGVDRITKPYGSDMHVLLNPKDLSILKLRLKDGPQKDRDREEVVLQVQPKTSRQRDLVALTTFVFAKKKDQQDQGAKSWARPGRDVSAKYGSSKPSSVLPDSIKPDEPPRTTDGEAAHERSGRRRHSHSHHTGEEGAGGEHHRRRRHSKHDPEDEERRAREERDLAEAMLQSRLEEERRHQAETAGTEAEKEGREGHSRRRRHHTSGADGEEPKEAEAKETEGEGEHRHRRRRDGAASPREEQAGDGAKHRREKEGENEEGGERRHHRKKSDTEGKGNVVAEEGADRERRHRRDRETEGKDKDKDKDAQTPAADGGEERGHRHHRKRDDAAGAEGAGEGKEEGGKRERRSRRDREEENADAATASKDRRAEGAAGEERVRSRAARDGARAEGEDGERRSRRRDRDTGEEGKVDAAAGVGEPLPDLVPAKPEIPRLKVEEVNNPAAGGDRQHSGRRRHSRKEGEKSGHEHKGDHKGDHKGESGHEGRHHHHRREEGARDPEAEADERARRAKSGEDRDREGHRSRHSRGRDADDAQAQGDGDKEGHRHHRERKSRGKDAEQDGDKGGKGERGERGERGEKGEHRRGRGKDTGESGAKDEDGHRQHRRSRHSGKPTEEEEDGDRKKHRHHREEAKEEEGEGRKRDRRSRREEEKEKEEGGKKGPSKEELKARLGPEGYEKYKKQKLAEKRQELGEEGFKAWVKAKKEQRDKRKGDGGDDSA